MSPTQAITHPPSIPCQRSQVIILPISPITKLGLSPTPPIYQPIRKNPIAPVFFPSRPFPPKTKTPQSKIHRHFPIRPYASAVLPLNRSGFQTGNDNLSGEKTAPVRRVTFRCRAIQEPGVHPPGIPRMAGSRAGNPCGMPLQKAGKAITCGHSDDIFSPMFCCGAVGTGYYACLAYKTRLPTRTKIDS